MDQKEALRLLSYLPHGTPVALYDKEFQPDPLIGRYTGLSLSKGEDIVNVATKGNNSAGLRLHDLKMISIILDIGGDT